MKTLSKHLSFSVLYLFFIHYAVLSQPNEPGSGNCLHFDGVNNYVNVPHHPSLSPTAVTVSAWVYPNTIAGNRNIVFKGDHQYLLQLRGGKVLYGSRSTSSAYNEFLGSLSVQPNTWTHIAITHDGSVRKIYINGVLDPVSSNQSGLYTGDTNPLKIGIHHFLIEPFDGQIDEVRIWNYARTQAEIREGMCQKLNGNEAGLIGYWRFDENSGTTAFDSSPNGNDGTLTNMNNTNWMRSAAAIGDSSVWLYPVSWSPDTILTLGHTAGDNLSVQNVTGNPDGVHIYYVDTVPSDTAGLTGYNAMPPDHYYGVFAANGSLPGYTVRCYYNGYPGIHPNNESTLILSKRDDNASTPWTDAGANLNIIVDSLVATGEALRGEYIFDNSLPFVICALSSVVSANDANCYGDSSGQAVITVSGGATPYVYNWSNGGSDSSVTGLPAGVFYVTVTDSLGCDIIDTIMIGEPAPLSTAITSTDDSSNCNGTTTVTASGGTSPYTYQWDANAGNQTTQTADSLCAGNYCVTVTDNNGCTKDTCVDVLLWVGYDLSVSHDQSIKVYPNPAGGSLFIRFEEENVRISGMRLLDPYGQIVWQLAAYFAFETEPVTVRLPHLAQGMYTLHILSGNTVYNKKIIIK